jgi:hypothetical protein
MYLILILRNIMASPDTVHAVHILTKPKSLLSLYIIEYHVDAGTERNEPHHDTRPEKYSNVS